MTLRVRCSQLGSIMTEPKAKGELLSVGAKTYVETQAKQFIYGYTPEVTTREMKKGWIVEPDSIKLLSELDFYEYSKNEQHFENDWLTGTPDILTDTHVKDVKSSWSVATFPALPADAYNKDYEWQLRGYLMLTDRNHAELAYCLVDTPEELLSDYEDHSIHFVSHIDPSLRVTRLTYVRDGATEAKIAQKVTYCQQYFQRVVNEILDAHR